MLFITHSPVHHHEGTVTGTLPSRHTLALVFGEGVIVLDVNECVTVLPDVQRFVEHHQHLTEGD